MTVHEPSDVRRFGVTGALAALVLAPCIACMPAPQQAQPESRVWSTANSNDGFAACPGDTVVTGGGYEIKDTDRKSGRVPLVVASKPEANGWRVVCVDAAGASTMSCRAWATCASVLSR